MKMGESDETSTENAVEQPCDVCEEGTPTKDLCECQQCSRYACRACKPIYRMICNECYSKNKAEAEGKPPEWLRPSSGPKGTKMRQIQWGRGTFPPDLNEDRRAKEKAREDEVRRRPGIVFDDGDWRYRKSKRDPVDDDNRSGVNSEARKTSGSDHSDPEQEARERSFFNQQCAEAAETMCASPDAPSYFEQQCAAAAAMMHEYSPDESDSSQGGEVAEQEVDSDGNEAPSI